MLLDPAAAAILLLSLLSVATTVIGVLLALSLRAHARAIALGTGFSTGIMILVSTLELLPEAQSAMGTAGAVLALLLGGAVLWGANRVLPHSHLVREHGQADTRIVRTVYLVVFGLVLHDVPEGFAMANSYLASPDRGLVVALAIALHNLPEEFAMAVPALALRSKRFLIGAAALSALAEPVGALIGLLAVALEPDLNGGFMAFAAGAMLFVSFHELLPMARRYGKLGWFAAGFALSVAAHQVLAFLVTGVP